MPKPMNLVKPVKPIAKSDVDTPKEAMRSGIAKFTGESSSYSFKRPQRKVLSRYSR